MQNLLAVAVATDITFKEAEQVSESGFRTRLMLSELSMITLLY